MQEDLELAQASSMVVSNIQEEAGLEFVILSNYVVSAARTYTHQLYFKISCC